ncbi:hypothetical protein [Megalodesulfovibrio paquesii]
MSQRLVSTAVALVFTLFLAGMPAAGHAADKSKAQEDYAKRFSPITKDKVRIQPFDPESQLKRQNEAIPDKIDPSKRKLGHVN